MGLLPKLLTVTSISIFEGKYHWIVNEEGGTPILFEANRYPHVKVGDIVEIVWRRHYGEENQLVVMGRRELYDPKEGF